MLLSYWVISDYSDFSVINSLFPANAGIFLLKTT